MDDSYPKLSIGLENAFELLDKLYASDVKRVNFAGGEPTLAKEFSDIVNYSHSLGIENTVVTNGTGINEGLMNKIDRAIKSVKLSIDSSDEIVEKSLGRGYGGHVSNIIRAAKLVRKHGVEVMANTVVTAMNINEDMHEIISKISPTRWKVFQVLPVDGQNIDEFKKLKISKEQFKLFIQRHNDICSMVPEDNDLMTESYIMIDPLGRFFQNKDSKYTLSDSILSVGVEKAFAQITFNDDKYKVRERGNV